MAFDFTMAFLPKDFDLSTDIVLLIVFIFFAIEIVILSLFRKEYFLSFWFYLDVIALVSMIPDMSLLLALFGADSSDVNISSARASRAGRSSRSAGAVKALRMIRFSRLLRVLRVFHFFNIEEHEEDDDADVVDASTSKIGQSVTDAVTKKVIMLVLTLVLVLPWFEPSSYSINDAAQSATSLFDLSIRNGADSTEALQFLENLPVPLLYVKHVDSGTETVYVNEASTIDSRRDAELWSLTISTGTALVLDIRESIFEEAYLGLLLTLFAIVIFGISTLFISSTTITLVVKPIHRLTELLMKMAGVIGLLGGAQTVENLVKEKDELFIVEKLCERVMDIFGSGNNSGKAAKRASVLARDQFGQPTVGLDPLKNTDDGNEPEKPKALGLMATQKVTNIKSGDREWQIEVREKHRGSIVEAKVHSTFRQFQASAASTEVIDPQEHEELTNLHNIVYNPSTNFCLRMFMTSNLTINNLLFVLEIDNWKDRCRSDFKQLYHRYCDDRSPAQINVSAKLFKEIAVIYDNVEEDIILEENDKQTGNMKVGSANVKIDAPQQNDHKTLSTDVFDKAYKETWHILQTNIYKQFLQSTYCKFYVHLKNTDPLTLNQLKMKVNRDENRSEP